MNKGLKNKGLGSWFCLAAALVALITGIVFLSTQATAAPLGHSGTMPGVVLLVGAAASLVFFFVSVPLGMPEHTQLALQFLTTQESIVGVVHAKELMILCNDLCSAAIVKNEVFYVIQQIFRFTRLREKIEDNPAAPVYIKNIRGLGYIWNQEVRQ